MNRGSQRDDLSERRLPAASMRPRFMNRGSSHLPTYDGSGGQCFNEAPIHESGKYGPSQCGCRQAAALQ